MLLYSHLSALACEYNFRYYVAIFKCLDITIVTVKFHTISIRKLNILQHCTESEKWKLFFMQLYARFHLYSQIGRFHNKVI